MSGFRDIGPMPAAENWRGAAVLAHDAEGRVLMQLRDDRDGVVARGQWSVFGGGVEPGEELDVAARREFHEETGIDITGDSLRPLARFASGAMADGMVYVFLLDRPVTPGEVRLGEGAGFAFLNRAQVLRFDLIVHLRQAMLDCAVI